MTTLLIIPTPPAFPAIRALAIGCAINLPVGQSVAVADTVKSVAYRYSPHPPNEESSMPGVDVAAHTLEAIMDLPGLRMVQADDVFTAGIKALIA